MSIINCHFSIIAVETFSQIISLLTIKDYGRFTQVCQAIPSLEAAPLFLKQKACELRLNQGENRSLVELFKKNIDLLRGLRIFLYGQQTKKEFGAWIQLLIVRNHPLLFKSVLDGTVHSIVNVEVRGLLEKQEPASPPTFRKKDFFSALKYAASHGYAGCLKEMLEHPWFYELDSLKFFEVARKTASRGQLECLGLLLTSGRFQELNPFRGEIAHEAAENGHAACLRLLLSDGRFDPLPQDELMDIIQRIVEKGWETCLKMVVVEGWFDEISSDEVSKMAGLAACYGRAGCLEIMTESHRFREIRRRELGQIFIAATFSGKKECVKSIYQSGRFQEIRKKDIKSAMHLARLLGYKKNFLLEPSSTNTSLPLLKW